MDYKTKYLKYKTKYIDLKEEMEGGGERWNIILTILNKPQKSYSDILILKNGFKSLNKNKNIKRLNELHKLNSFNLLIFIYAYESYD